MNNSEVTRRYVKICKLQHEIELQFEELHNRKKRIESALNFLSDADDAIEALLNEKEALQKQVAELKEKLAKYESSGYVLVPKEPSGAMVKAGSWHEYAHSLPDNHVMEIYKAMIEAAQAEGV